MYQLLKVYFRMLSAFKAAACFEVTLFRADFFDGSCCETCSELNCLDLSDTFVMLFNK